MNQTNAEYRHELKFIISNTQRVIIENSLQGVMQKDTHLKGDSYNIRSIYFDDYQHSCYYENENGVDPREKFRIRTYDCDDSFIRLELKRKEHGMTQKLQCKLSLEQYQKILAGGPLQDFDKLPSLLKKFELQRKMRLLQPDIIVSYNRIPYTYALGNVRITFDSDIASSYAFDDFYKRGLSKRPILQKDMLILEVKYDELLPNYIEKIVKSVTEHKISFSKYYLCKRYSFFGDAFCL